MWYEKKYLISGTYFLNFLRMKKTNFSYIKYYCSIVELFQSVSSIIIHTLFNLKKIFLYRHRKLIYFLILSFFMLTMFFTNNIILYYYSFCQFSNILLWRQYIYNLSYERWTQKYIIFKWKKWVSGKRSIVQ